MAVTKTTFVDFYRGKCSDELAEWASRWVQDLLSARMKKRSLPVLAGYRRANFRSLARFGPAAYDLLIALDVSLIVVEIQAVCHLAALRDEDYCASPGKRAQVGSAASLLIYIMQTCRAVRMSLLDDNDISARILARSISEACDMLIVTQSDHEFALRYANSDDDFRFFWHSEIAKEKLQRRKRAIVGCFFESDHKIVSDIEAYQRAESEAFSRATHPAYIAGIMYAFQILHEKKGTEPGWEFLGRWMGERSAVFSLIVLVFLSASCCLIELPTTSSSVSPKNNSALTQKVCFGIFFLPLYRVVPSHRGIMKSTGGKTFRTQTPAGRAKGAARPLRGVR